LPSSCTSINLSIPKLLFLHLHKFFSSKIILGQKVQDFYFLFISKLYNPYTFQALKFGIQNSKFWILEFRILESRKKKKVGVSEKDEEKSKIIISRLLWKYKKKAWRCRKKLPVNEICNRGPFIVEFLIKCIVNFFF